MCDKDLFSNLINEDEILLYGVGISYLEALALPNTLKRVLLETEACLVEMPLSKSDYFCHVYYTSFPLWKNGLDVLKKNFAITSSKLYLKRINISELLENY